jgi:hypothetical protein
MGLRLRFNELQRVTKPLMGRSIAEFFQRATKKDPTQGPGQINLLKENAP